MRITGLNDTSVVLRPTGYQFPAATDGFDAQWLMTTGQITLNGRGWSFTDPCLRISEAHKLTSWLHAAAAGHLRPRQLPADPGEEWEPDLSFTEPVVAFSLGSGSPGFVLRVNASLEAASPWICEEQRFPWGHAVDLQLSAPQLEQAASEWSSDLRDLPHRSASPRDRHAWP